MEYLLFIIIMIVVLALIRNNSEKYQEKNWNPKNSWLSDNHEMIKNSYSQYPITFINRQGKTIKADVVFHAWTSGNLNQMIGVLDHPTNNIDRHYLLQSIVKIAYNKRENPEMRKLCAKIAEIHISEFPKIKKDLEKEFIGFSPRVPTFQQYASLLTEQGDYQKAIWVCTQALNFGLRDGTKSGFEGRIKRILKKMGNH